MCRPTTLRALCTVALVGLFALFPATASAAPQPDEERPFLVRLRELVERIVGAEEGGPGIDPLGLSGSGNEPAPTPAESRACHNRTSPPANGSR